MAGVVLVSDPRHCWRGVAKGGLFVCREGICAGGLRDPVVGVNRSAMDPILSCPGGMGRFVQSGFSIET